ncbi:hypothetical protein HOG98_01420 [bacterium]|jgi:hypothetical protein|nr:hypothetical protein [bacterium]
MGSIIFKILSTGSRSNDEIRRGTDCSSLDVTFSSLITDKSGLVPFLSNAKAFQSLPELKTKVDSQIDEFVLHLKNSTCDFDTICAFLSLKDSVSDFVKSDNKDDVCSFLSTVGALYSKNVIPEKVLQSIDLKIDQIKKCNVDYFKRASYMKLFKTFSLTFLLSYFSNSTHVLPALSIYPLGANLECGNGGNVDMEKATAKLSNHPVQQCLDGVIDEFIAKDMLLQSVPWQMHKHVPMGIRIFLGAEIKAVSEIDGNALGAMTYVTAGGMVSLYKSFCHVLRDSIYETASFLKKDLFDVSEKKKIEESFVFCDTELTSLNDSFFSSFVDDFGMPICRKLDFSTIVPFFRTSGLPFIQDLYLGQSDDFETIDRQLIVSLEQWSYIVYDDKEQIHITSDKEWGTLNCGAKSGPLTGDDVKALFNIILPKFYMYERAEDYVSKVEKAVRKSAYVKNKETIPRRFILDDYHDFFDPNKTDGLIENVSDCLLDFSEGVPVNLECVSDALFLTNVVSERGRDSSYIIALDIFQRVTQDVLLKIEERVSGNLYLLNRIAHVKSRYDLVTNHDDLKTYQKYLDGTIDLSNKEDMNLLGSSYIKFNAPFRRIEGYAEKVSE